MSIYFELLIIRCSSINGFCKCSSNELDIILSYIFFWSKREKKRKRCSL